MQLELMYSCNAKKKPNSSSKHWKGSAYEQEETPRPLRLENAKDKCKSWYNKLKTREEKSSKRLSRKLSRYAISNCTRSPLLLK